MGKHEHQNQQKKNFCLKETSKKLTQSCLSDINFSKSNCFVSIMGQDKIEQFANKGKNLTLSREMPLKCDLDLKRIITRQVWPAGRDALRLASLMSFVLIFSHQTFLI